MSLPACPNRDQLDLFQAGDLEEGVLAAVASHVESCTTCQKSLETLIGESGDAVLAALLEEPQASPFAEEAACRVAVERAAALASETASVGGESGPTVAESAASERSIEDPYPGRSPEGEELPLRSIREYKLLSKLGEGGMGAVYKALHTRLDKVVALKVLPADRMQDSGSVARFQREMKAVGRLDHPNIVRAMDAGKEAGTHFLVMEYVEGSDLSQLAKTTCPLPLADACELIRQAALGLQEAHEHGMVHRDIKPSNLILAKSPQKKSPPTLKILDLGLALLSEALSPDHQGLTSTGQMMGTIDYMAPEQGSDTHNVDIRADIYSLGATLYRLLTGAAPFAGAKLDTPVKKILALATQEPPPVQSRRADVPPQLAAIVHKMLAKNPAQRFATPEELAEALAPFCQGANLAALLERRPQPSEPASPASEAPTHEQRSSPSADTAATTLPQLPLGGGRGEGAEKGKPREGEAPAKPIRQGGRREGEAPAEPNLPSRLAALGRKIPRPIAIAAACGGAALLVLLGIVLFWQTPQGTVRIEINDKDISAKFDSTGLVITGADEKPIRVTAGGKKPGKGERAVPAGEQTLTITRGDFTFKTTSFQLDAKGTTVLRIELIAGTIQVTKDGQLLKKEAISRGASDDRSLDLSQGGRIELPRLLRLNKPLTVEMFVTPLAMPPKDRGNCGLAIVPGASLIFKQHGGTRWIFQSTDAKNELVSVVATDAVILGRKTHLAGVRTEDEIRLFVDGKLVDSQAIQGAVDDNLHSLVMGGDGGAANWSSLQGHIDEIRISDVARYNQDFTPKPRFEPDANTLALYHCDEGQGSELKDSSGHSHHGKIAGAKWLRIDGATGKVVPSASDAGGLAFNGQGDHVRIPIIPFEPREPITVEAWFTAAAGDKPNAVTVEAKTDSIISAFSPKKPAGFNMILDRAAEGWFFNRLDERFSDSNYYWFVRKDKRTDYYGVRHHAALVWDGNAVSLFVDGVRQKSGETHVDRTKTPDIVLPKLDYSLIGACASPADGKTLTRFFQGTLDELRISRTALYVANFKPALPLEKAEHTLALYHFDEGQGDILNDSSGNNHHGKIVGAKWVKVESAPPSPAPAPEPPPPAGGHALRFAETTDRVETPDVVLNAREPWTVEGWVTPRPPLPKDGEQAVVFLVDQVWLSIHNRYPGARWTSGGPLAKPGPAINKSDKFLVGERAHLALQHGPKGVSMFVNGVRQGEPLPFVFLNEQPTLRLCLRGNPERRDMPFFGDLDEVRVSKIERYKEDFTPKSRFEPDADTLALYHCDQGQGDVLEDSSGNNRHGKIVGAKWAGATGISVPANPLKVEDDAGRFGLEFNGKDNWVDLPTLKYDGSHPITIEATIAPANLDVKNGAIFSDLLIVPGGSRGLALQFPCDVGSSGRFLYDDTVGYQSVFTEKSLASKERLRVAAVLNGSVAILFVNGKQQARANLRGNFRPETRAFRIGASHAEMGDHASQYFSGQITEIRISKVARYDKDYVTKWQLDADAETLALYRFNEGQGNVLRDSSGNNHHGTIVGAKWVAIAQRAEAGQQSLALEFDGKSSLVKVPSLRPPTDQPLTIEAFVKFEKDAAVLQALASFYSPDNALFVGRNVGNVPVFFARRELESKFGGMSGKLDSGKWLHLAGVWDGKESRLYIDGKQHPNSLVRTISSDMAAPQNQYFMLGAEFGIDGLPSVNFFPGYLAEVRLSKIARYEKEFAPPKLGHRFQPDEHTLALYHCDEGAGDELRDSSSHNHHGKAERIKWVPVEGDKLR